MLYFDCGGVVGHGKKMGQSISELLQGMNRMGIHMSTVYSMKAKDYSTLTGNQELINELELLPEKDRERLVPVCVITPAIGYVQEGISHLKALMNNHGVRCVFCSLNGKSVINIEAIIEEIYAMSPLVYISMQEIHCESEMHNFFTKFPGVNFIITDVSFSYVNVLLSFMSNHENVYASLALIHTRDTLELLVDMFGDKRILFGTTPATNGAGMASLVHSNLSNVQKENIAAANIIRLLQKDNTLDESNYNFDESFWMKFINEKIVPMEIIDAHGHIGLHNTLIVKEVDLEQQIDNILDVMNNFNIGCTLISGLEALLSDAVQGNWNLLNVAKKYIGKFFGYVVFNANYGEQLINQFDAYFMENFFIGFKIHGDFSCIKLSDERFNPVYEYADKFRLPILVHCYSGTYSDPLYLKHILRQYPKAIFILGHAGGDNAGRRICEEYAKVYDNVYLEFCGSFDSDISWTDTVGRISSKKVVFGTDSMFHNPVWELGRLLSLDLPIGDFEYILHKNIVSILKLRCAE